MSNAAIGRALELLQELPDSDQQAVLQFLKSLKNSAAAPSPAKPALQKVDGLLVFTGDIGNPGADWLKTIREERDHEISRAATAHDAVHSCLQNPAW